MKKLTYLLVSMSVLVFVGCSTVKTKVSTGPIAARTFSFLNPGAKAAPAAADKRSQVHAAIQEAITRNLAGKGLSLSAAGGEVTVAYLVIAGNNVTTTSLNEYFGYASDSSELVDKVHTEQAVKGANREYIEAGTLVIDLLDPKTSKLLKRSSISAPILRDLPLDSRRSRLQSIVDQALSDLRVVNPQPPK